MPASWLRLTARATVTATASAPPASWQRRRMTARRFTATNRSGGNGGRSAAKSAKAARAATSSSVTGVVMVSHSVLTAAALPVVMG